MNDLKDTSRFKGVVADSGDQLFPKELITVGKTRKDALGRDILRDEQQRNALIIYVAQLKMFDMVTEQDDVRDWLNASPAIDGVNRRQALMGWVRIYEPVSAGGNVDKNTQKALIETQRQRLERQKEDHNNQNGGPE